MSLRNRTKIALTVDCVVFRSFQEQNQILLVKRGKEPFLNSWALPGGFLENEETLEECAFRELKEETGIGNLFLKQLHAYSDPNRDPRGRVVTVSFYAVVQPFGHQLVPTEDVSEAKWWDVDALPSLAFDHKKIVQKAKMQLRSDLVQSATVFQILPQKFTLGQVQTLLECFLDRKLDKRNFRKKLLSFEFLHETGEVLAGMKQRPAKLYSFSKKCYERVCKKEVRFSLL